MPSATAGVVSTPAGTKRSSSMQPASASARDPPAGSNWPFPAKLSAGSGSVHDPTAIRAPAWPMGLNEHTATHPHRRVRDADRSTSAYALTRRLSPTPSTPSCACPTARSRQGPLAWRLRCSTPPDPRRQPPATPATNQQLHYRPDHLRAPGVDGRQILRFRFARRQEPGIRHDRSAGRRAWRCCVLPGTPARTCYTWTRTTSRTTSAPTSCEYRRHTGEDFQRQDCTWAALALEPPAA